MKKPLIIILNCIIITYINRYINKWGELVHGVLNFTDKELSSWLVDNKKNIELENFSVSKKIKNFKLKF